jgi:hypothetical protein
LKTSWEGSRNPYLSSLEVEPGCGIEQLQGALNELAEANQRHATPTQIAKGLAVLTAVCAKPADFDDAKVVLWSERLKVVLQEYPDDVAMAAISSWPKTENGKWWPTENELRSRCDELMAFRLNLKSGLERAAAMATPRDFGPPPSDGFSDEPEGATADYVRTIFAVKPDKASAYLSGARFKENKIGIRYPMAQLALESACPGLLAQHGVRIVTPRAFRSDGLVEWAE